MLSNTDKSKFFLISIISFRCRSQSSNIFCTCNCCIYQHQCLLWSYTKYDLSTNVLMNHRTGKNYRTSMTQTDYAILVCIIASVRFKHKLTFHLNFDVLKRKCCHIEKEYVGGTISKPFCIIPPKLIICTYTTHPLTVFVFIFM